MVVLLSPPDPDLRGQPAGAGAGLRQEQAALLSLLTRHRRSYGDLAVFLSLTEGDIRDRTRAAITALVGPAAASAPDRLVDYAVGALTDRQVAGLQADLRRHAAERELAAAMVGAVAGLGDGIEAPRSLVPATSASALTTAGRRQEPSVRARTGATVALALAMIALGATLYVDGARSQPVGSGRIGAHR